MTQPPVAAPARTAALIVGIEEYPNPDWRLKGVGEDARRFVHWLLGRAVPPDQVLLHLAEETPAGPLYASVGDERLEVKVLDANHATIGKSIRFTLQELGEAGLIDLLVVYWAGHGYLDDDRKRCLDCADSRTKDRQSFDVDSLLAIVRCRPFPELTAAFIDACAFSLSEQEPGTKPRPTKFQLGTGNTSFRQFVFFAAREGQLAEYRRGDDPDSFAAELLEALKDDDSRWPPDLPKAAKRVKDRFAKLRVVDNYRQIPVFTTFSWDGDPHDDDWSRALAAQAEGLGERAPREALLRREQVDCAKLRLLRGEVPVDRLYQEQPLLFEIRRERLPRGVSEVEGSKEGDEPDRHCSLIEQWEEEVRGERVVTKPCTIEELFTDFRSVVETPVGDVPRFVLLGQPGGGKSTLVQVLAYHAARGKLRQGSLRLVPARVALRAWERAAEDPVLASLSAYLARRTRDLLPVATEALWRRWLQRGEVLLLLDGLDEIADQRRFENEVLKAALTDFPTCPTVLTCRTINFEQHRAACPDLPIFLLSGLEDAQRAAYIRAYRDAFRARFDAQALIDKLNRHPAMRPLAANPLLLSIICFVVDDPDGLELPATRGELYDQAVDKLLGYYESHKRLKPQYPSEQPGVSEKRKILEYVALELFARSRDSLTFDEDALGKSLRRALAAVGYGGAAAPWANALRKDLIHNSGLLRGDADRDYFFLHLTVQEFLAASALARRVDDDEGKGWESVIWLAGRNRTVREFVDRKAWDPHWREVITLLVGRLQEARPLLETLRDPAPTATNPTGDDVFRHRLALASRCLPEVPASRHDALSEAINEITTQVFSIWWGAFEKNIVTSYHHIARALPALAQVNGRVPSLRVLKDWSHAVAPHRRVDLSEGLPLLDRLATMLGDRDPGLSRAAAEAVDALGGAAATPGFLDRLARLLGDGNRDVRLAAARVVGALGGAAARADILDRLATMLGDRDGFVRSTAAGAVGALGAAAATPEFLDCLAILLGDSDRDVRSAAAEAVAALGGAAATPEFLDRLARLLVDGDRDVRLAAAGTVSALGGAAARADILDRLATMLGDGNRDVRLAAARVVGALGGAAARADILDRLATMLGDRDGFVRSTAAGAVGALGGAAATPEFLDRLAILLGDGDRDLRSAAAEAVAALGGAAATPAFLDRLATMLGDHRRGDYKVRLAAAEAVASLGGAAARADILDRLATMLGDDRRDNYDVGLAAAEAVAALGGAAARADILDRLATVLGNRDPDVRLAAAGAVGALGAAAATPEFLDRLATMLGDRNLVVRLAAARVVGALGVAAARADILDRLATMLGAGFVSLRSAAARAVSALGGAAARADILDRLAILLGDGDRDVRLAAAEAVGALGGAAARADTLDRLATMLGDRDGFVRSTAARAVGALGGAAASPEFLDCLATMLGDRDRDVRLAAAGAVGALGGAAATPEFLDRLARLLGDGDRDPRSAAARAVSALGGAAATPEFLDRLARLLCDGNRDVRLAAAGAVGALGGAAARPDILDRLATMLGDGDRDVRSAAAEAVRALDGAAATPEFLDCLAILLGDGDGPERRAVTKKIGALGVAAARPDILDRLATLLGDGNKSLLSAAVEAVGALGAAAARPDILDHLATLLGGDDWRVRSAAVRAVGALGAAAATPGFLDRLATLLGDGDESVRSAAAVRAVGALGVAAATPEFLDRLATLLGDSNTSVRLAAAEVSGKLMNGGARIFKTGDRWGVQVVGDLSR